MPSNPCIQSLEISTCWSLRKSSQIYHIIYNIDTLSNLLSFLYWLPEQSTVVWQYTKVKANPNNTSTLKTSFIFAEEQTFE